MSSRPTEIIAEPTGGTPRIDVPVTTTSFSSSSGASAAHADVVKVTAASGSNDRIFADFDPIDAPLLMFDG
jgi:hypothetical protein